MPVRGLWDCVRLLTNGQGQENERHVRLVICERLVNMPVKVVPLMYRD